MNKDDEVRRAFAEDVERGLTAKKKYLPCRWFYDDAGSRLFEEICTLDEYYPPRAEREILERRAAEIARLSPPGAELVELGSGNAAKTRLVIAALLEKQGLLRYLPIDVSRTMLEETARALLAEYRGLEVSSIAADYEAGLAALSAEPPCPKLILWLGSNIGNFDRREAAEYLQRIKAVMQSGDALLVGADLRKDRRTLEAAYDDARGVTAAFNKNILHRINRELGGSFDLDRYDHRAIYVEDEGRIEMYLVSRAAQRVAIRGIELEVAFEEGEAIHTESSYKYDHEELRALADRSGLRLEELWTDSENRFADVLFRRAP